MVDFPWSVKKIPRKLECKYSPPATKGSETVKEMDMSEEPGTESDVDEQEEAEVLRVFPNIFVTVGTTSFDGLIELVTVEETLAQMEIWETKEVKVQIGNSKIAEEGTSVLNGIQFTFYRYKNSLDEDIAWADLVICHAGAGTTLDVLDAGKIICVIPNDSLMDNHQSELADCIAERGYGFSATIDQFHAVAPNISASVLPFPKSNVHKLLELIETDLLNLDPEEVSEAKRQYEEKLQERIASQN